MNFNKFSTSLRPLVVFNTNDVFKIFPDFNLMNLSNWRKQNYIIKLAKGFYTFGDTEVDDSLLYYASNKIIEPSYVSCESALSYYNVVHMENRLTSVCHLKSYQYKSDFGVFKYHKISDPGLLNNTKLVNRNGYFFKIAALEKALADYFFFNPIHQTRAQIKKLEFNKERISSLVDHETLISIAEDYQNESLNERIRNFLKVFYEKQS